MPPFHTDALVLRTYKMGETSNVVVLLTRERGKVRAVAKGSRGPRARHQAALLPLSEVRVGLYGRQGAELFRMGGCELVRSAFPASQELEVGLVLGYFAELLDAFALEGTAEDAVYRLALAVLKAAEGGTDTTVLSRYLEAWLLKLHGLYPPVNRCVTCGNGLPAGPLPPLLGRRGPGDGQHRPAQLPLPRPAGHAVPADEPARRHQRAGNLRHVCLLTLMIGTVTTGPADGPRLTPDQR